MNMFLLNTRGVALVLLFGVATFFTTAAAQTPRADCVGSLTINITPNNTAVLSVQHLNNGNSVGTLQGEILPTNPNGSPIPFSTNYTFSCMQVGSYSVRLIASNANGSDTCYTNVIVSDSNGRCGSTNNLGSNSIDASSCVICDGACGFYLMNANGATIQGPVSFVWNNGLTQNIAAGDLAQTWQNNLCSGNYSVTATYSGFTYTSTIWVGCSNGGTSNCIDHSRIDTSMACPTLNVPVCGCDSVTYNNACQAEHWYGITSWTIGVCGQNQPNPNGIAVTDSIYNPNGCDTACTGTITLTISGGTAPYATIWSDGNVGEVHPNICSNHIYTATVTDAAGESEIHTVYVPVARGCVWPGDTDDDAMVSFFDVLPIALAYGESGAMRPNASTAWYSQQCNDWMTVNPLPSLPNYKHIDANGDGLVNQTDVQAVVDNYSDYYYRSGSLNGSIPFFVESATVNEGDRIHLDITLGDQTNVAHDVYGVAFTLEYDPTMVVGGTIDIDFSDSWLGADLIYLTRESAAQGRLEAVVTRKDRLNITSFGNLGTLNLTIRDDILRHSTRSMNLIITNVRLINNINTIIGTDRQNTGIVTVNSATAVQEISNDYHLQIFPNPAKETIHIRVQDAQIEQIRLVSLTGQVIDNQHNINNTNASFSVQQLSSGVYILSVITNKGIRNERIEVRH